MLITLLIKEMKVSPRVFTLTKLKFYQISVSNLESGAVGTMKYLFREASANYTKLLEKSGEMT